MAKLLAIMTGNRFLIVFTAFTFFTAKTFAFNLDQFKILLTQSAPHTTDEAIQLLPQDLLKNFTLVYHSHSVHASSPLAPRVIVWSEEGKFILSWNGGSVETPVRGGNVLELIQFNDTSRRLEFHEIKISRGQTIIHQPTTCISCHGESLKPIWREYPRWPGAYGSKDDRFTPEEKINYDTFISKVASTHPRYQKLFEIKNKHEIKNDADFPYRPLDQNSDEFLSVRYRPNLRLSLLLTRLYALSLAEKIKSSPQYSVTKKELLAELFQCHGDSEKKLSEIFTHSFKLTQNDLDLGHIFQTETNGTDPRFEPHSWRESYFDGNTSLLEYLAQQLSQDPTFRNTPLLTRTMNNKYKSSLPRNRVDQPMFNFLDSLLTWVPLPYPKNDKTVKLQKREDFRNSFKEDQLDFCNSLRKTHTLPAEAESFSRSSPLKGFALLQQKCAGCHQDGFIFHFDDEDALRKQISLYQKSFVKHVETMTDPTLPDSKRMPLFAAPLNENERSDILEYLKQYSSKKRNFVRFLHK